MLMTVTVGQASGFVQPWMADSYTGPAHGRVPPRHGRGDSLGFVPHSFDLNGFVCFFYCVSLLYNKTVFI